MKERYCYFLGLGLLCYTRWKILLTSNYYLSSTGNAMSSLSKPILLWVVQPDVHPLTLVLTRHATSICDMQTKCQHIIHRFDLVYASCLIRLWKHFGMTRLTGYNFQRKVHLHSCRHQYVYLGNTKPVYLPGEEKSLTWNSQTVQHSSYNHNTECIQIWPMCSKHQTTPGRQYTRIRETQILNADQRSLWSPQAREKRTCGRGRGWGTYLRRSDCFR